MLHGIELGFGHANLQCSSAPCKVAPKTPDTWRLAPGTRHKCESRHACTRQTVLPMNAVRQPCSTGGRFEQARLCGCCRRQWAREGEVRNIHESLNLCKARRTWSCLLAIANKFQGPKTLLKICPQLFRWTEWKC